jgi:hypothetical protein
MPLPMGMNEITLKLPVDAGVLNILVGLKEYW